MIGVVTSIYRAGDPRRPDGEPATPCLYVAVSGDREHPDPEQRQIDDLVCTYSGEPPPPLSMCRFTDEKVPQLVGPIGLDVKPIFRDDFACIDSPAGRFGDTNWNSLISGAGVNADAGDTIAGAGLGVTRIQCRNAANASTAIHKDVGSLDAGAADAWWAIAKVRLPTNTNVQTWVGFGTSLATDGVQLFYSEFFPGVWMLRTLTGGSGTLVGTSTAPDPSTFITADLVFTPGGFAALWIDGDGPYYTTATIPTTGGAVTPAFEVMTLTAANKNLDVDLLEFTAITGPIAHPETHELFTL